MQYKITRIMKRLSRKNKLYHIRVTLKRTKRKQRHKRRSEKLTRVNSQWDEIINAPSVLSITDKTKRTKFLRFINALQLTCNKHNKKILLDFSNTSTMIADAALLFRAHICRTVNIIQPSVTIKIRLSSESKVNEALKQIGVFSLLNQNPQITLTDPDVVHWRYAQGTGAEGEKYEEILGGYDGAITSALSSGLYLGLTEAMTNTRQHAYPNRENRSNLDSCGNNEWWMFSQEKDGYLYVVFCDLGIGIPSSLPLKNPNLWQRLTEKLGKKPSDSEAIKEAIMLSKSRTGKKHRGKGLKQLTSVLEKVEGGRLVLHSNHGCYTIKCGAQNAYDYTNKIPGTLISWSLPLQAKEAVY